MVFGAQLSKEVVVFFGGNFAYMFAMYKNLEQLLSSSWKWKVRLNFKTVMFGNFQIMQQRERSEPLGPPVERLSATHKSIEILAEHI